MKLSEIVAYLNLLDTLDVHDEAAESTRKLAAILHVVTGHEIQVNNCTQALQQNYNSVTNALTQFDSTLAQIKQRLMQMWHEQEAAYLFESRRLFEQEMRYDSPQYILSRQLNIDDESKTVLEFKLKNLTDWRLPGLILGARNESFVKHMVPMDPLYVVDTHADLIFPAVKDFTPSYQQRLRQYVIDDFDSTAILNDIPGNQFGLVFAYNYFNYRPMEVITRYIREIVSKLRPGGSFIMTYNNCDRAHGIGLAERSWMCYTPKRLIVSAAADVGLELVSAEDRSGDVSWLEFVRPGELTTLRGGQCIAKIIAIPQ
jgi:SAM-dependent methyltransferase